MEGDCACAEFLITDFTGDWFGMSYVKFHNYLVQAGESRFDWEMR
jgi:hypothetical protein